VAKKDMIDLRDHKEKAKEEKDREHLYGSSIHPRVVNGKTRHNKVNTCITVRKSREKVVARMEKHHERHPNDMASKKHLEKIRRAA